MASLDFSVGPNRRIVSGVIQEATGTTAGHPERAHVYLGLNGSDWTYAGTIHNGHGLAGGANGVIQATAPMISWTTSPVFSPAGGGFITTFNFTVLSGAWNKLRIMDGRGMNSSGGVDGFDIAEFQVTTNAAPSAAPVPEPASMAVLGAGLLGLAALRRRRRA
jgi:hypothetical protein